MKSLVGKVFWPASGCHIMVGDGVGYPGASEFIKAASSTIRSEVEPWTGPARGGPSGHPYAPVYVNAAQ
jgi:hypothetical protein